MNIKDLVWKTPDTKEEALVVLTHKLVDKFVSRSIGCPILGQPDAKTYAESMIAAIVGATMETLEASISNEQQLRAIKNILKERIYGIRDNFKSIFEYSLISVLQDFRDINDDVRSCGCTKPELGAIGFEQADIEFLAQHIMGNVEVEHTEENGVPVTKRKKKD